MPAARTLAIIPTRTGCISLPVLCKETDVTSRTAIFGTEAEQEDKQDKLVELFRKRAELKKDFAELRKEKHRLEQRVREQQGATARIVQKLDHLENLLIDPEWAHTVVVFYQLRAINRRCQHKLAKFAEQLKQQRERRMQDVQLADWHQKRELDAAAMQRKLGEHRMQLEALEDQLAAERFRIESMSGLEKVLKGRSATSGIDDVEARVAAARTIEQDLMKKLDGIQSRAAPETRGLALEDKRSINFLVIAFAQALYLHFRDERLVALVKESGDKSVGAINYGSKSDCDALLGLIGNYNEQGENQSDCADTLQKRSALIAEHAVFAKDDDAVPIAGSVATVFAIDNNGVVRPKDVNLLGENYWNVTEVFSR